MRVRIDGKSRGGSRAHGRQGRRDVHLDRREREMELRHRGRVSSQFPALPGSHGGPSKSQLPKQKIEKLEHVIRIESFGAFSYVTVLYFEKGTL
jgi:hypothetical protein